MTPENEPLNATRSGEEFELIPFRSRHTSRIIGGACDLTIVNTKKHGKRITISADILNAVGAAQTIHLASYRDGIAIGSKLQGVAASPFAIKRSSKNDDQTGGKGVVYCGELVEELTELFDLDFEDRTSISFDGVTYRNMNGLNVALVPLRQTVQEDPDNAEIEVQD